MLKRIVQWRAMTTKVCLLLLPCELNKKYDMFLTRGMVLLFVVFVKCSSDNLNEYDFMIDNDRVWMEM